MATSTHLALSKLLVELATRLEQVPTGYCVSDAGTLKALRDAAAALVAQDARIGELTQGLRELGGREARRYFQHHQVER